MIREDAMGIRRYVFMQTETAIALIVAGVPMSQAIRKIIEVSLLDQAGVCAVAGRMMAAESGNEDIQDWYRKRCDGIIGRVRPSAGVASEAPMPSYEAAMLAQNPTQEVGDGYWLFP